MELISLRRCRLTLLLFFFFFSFLNTKIFRYLQEVPSNQKII